MDNLRLKVENIVAKGEIARFEQFLLFHYVIKTPSAAEASESVYMRERIKRPKITVARRMMYIAYSRLDFLTNNL